MRATASVFAATILAACGGTTQNTGTGTGTTAGTGNQIGQTGPGSESGAGDRSAGAVCDRILTLKNSGCPFMADYEQDRDGCIKDVDDAAGDPLAEKIKECILDQPDCDGTSQCINQAFADLGGGDDGGGGGSSMGYRECADTSSFGPVGYPRAEWNKRHGAIARHYGDVPSSQQTPIEVCEVQGQLDWLTQVTCADGSSPFGDPSDAHSARAGSVGSGGRCGAIIDLYEVPCPEGTYQIYMDMYVCPLN